MLKNKCFNIRWFNVSMNDFIGMQKIYSVNHLPNPIKCNFKVESLIQSLHFANLISQIASQLNEKRILKT